MTAWHEGNELILAVAAQNNNTIVVVNSVGPIIMEGWIEHPNGEYGDCMRTTVMLTLINSDRCGTKSTSRMICRSLP